MSATASGKMRAANGETAPTGANRVGPAAGILIVTLLAGCRATLPATTTQPAVPTDANAELIEYIGELPYVTAEAAYRAVRILGEGEIFEGDYAALTDVLTEAGIVSPTWDLPPDAFVDRAVVGYMVCRACEIRTGLNWRLTGLGRYAWRELQYRRIAGPGGEYGYVSGGEFLGILARAEDYLHKTGRRVERVELGEEPPATP